MTGPDRPCQARIRGFDDHTKPAARIRTTARKAGRWHPHWIRLTVPTVTTVVFNPVVLTAGT